LRPRPPRRQAVVTAAGGKLKDVYLVTVHRGSQRRGPGHPVPVALRYAMPISRRLPSRKVTVSV